MDRDRKVVKTGIAATLRLALNEFDRRLQNIAELHNEHISSLYERLSRIADALGVEDSEEDVLQAIEGMRRSQGMSEKRDAGHRGDPDSVTPMLGEIGLALKACKIDVSDYYVGDCEVTDSTVTVVLYKMRDKMYKACPPLPVQGKPLEPSEPRRGRREPASEILQFFTYAHLPANLRKVSEPFAVLAKKFSGMSEAERHDKFDVVRSLLEKMEEELPRNSQSELCFTRLRYVEDVVTEKYDLDTVLQALLEAKDCAVRAIFLRTEGE